MSAVHLCDRKDHVLDEGHCGHVFAVVEVKMSPSPPQHLCGACLGKFTAQALTAKTAEYTVTRLGGA